MKQFSLKKLLAVVLSIMMIMTVMPMAIFAAPDANDAVTTEDLGLLGNNGKAIIYEEGDVVALSLGLYWNYHDFTGDWTPQLDKVIPAAVEKYNTNHGTDIAITDITKMVVDTSVSYYQSFQGFATYLHNSGFASRLVELDLSMANFINRYDNTGDTTLYLNRFAPYGGATYFPNLKVLDLSGTAFTKIEYNALNNMTALEEIVLPKGLTTIENDAFSGCTSLKSISFPDTMATFGVNVFLNCSAVESWSFHGSNDGAAAIIKQMNDFTNYTKVDLSGSEVTAATVLGLKNTITYLNLSDCPNIDYSTDDGFSLYGKIVQLKANGAEVIAPDFEGFNADEILDKVTGYGGCNGRLYVENDVVTLDLGIVWTFDNYTGDWTPALDTLIPEIIAKYNENHETEYAKGDIKKIVVTGNADQKASLNGFIKFLYDYGYASNLVELDLTKSYFVSWTWNSTHMIEQELFAHAYGNSKFPNLKVLKLGGVQVIAIANNAFNHMTSLETIELPATLTSIGPWAFQDCSSLKAIDFPDTMVSLGDSVFYDCSAIESWSYHGTGACAEMLLAQLNEFTNYEKVDLSGSGISSAAALTIKDDVTYLNLSDCPNIEYESEEGDALFDKLWALEQAGIEVYYPENPNYDPYEFLDTIDSVYEGIKYATGRLIVKDDSVKLQLNFVTACDYMTGDWTPQLDTFIPAVVAKYNENHGTELTKADINAIKVIGNPDAPSSLKRFLDDIIYGQGYANNLVELDLSESYFVRYTWEPTGATLANGMYTAYNGSSYFPKLKVLKLDTVNATVVGYNVFNNMTTLETITLPNTITTIENDAFKNCSSLKSIDFPRSLKSMGVYVFYGCSSLESWSYHGSSMSSINFFGENNLNVTPYSKVDLSGSSVDSETALKLRDSLTYLNLSNCVNIEYESESGKSLWAMILKLREAGAEVIAPENLDFDYDEAMDTVTGDGGEWDATVDARILKQDDAVVLNLIFKYEYNDFVGDWTPQLDKLIPRAIDTYNTNHSTEVAAADITKVVVAVREDGDFDLALPNFIKFIRSTEFAANLEVLDLSEGNFTRDKFEDADTKVIDNQLFAPYDDGTSYFPKLKVLKLGGSQFTSIAYNAFNHLTALEEIELPANLQKIEGAVFKGCTALKSIALPDSLNSIDRYAFEGCTALESWSYHGSVAERDDPENFYNDLFVGFRDIQKVYTSVDVSGSTVNADNVRRISASATYVNLTDCPNIYIGAKGPAAYAKLQELRANGATVIAPEVIFGDVDNDGSVNADDLTAIRKVLIGGSSEELNTVALDANEDGAVDIIDLVRAKKVFAGI